VEIRKFDMKITRNLFMVAFDIGDMFFRTNSFFFGFQHDGGAVCVVCAEISAIMTTELLESHPDVRLGLLKNMPQMQVAIGIGQGTGNEDLTSHRQKPVILNAGGNLGAHYNIIRPMSQGWLVLLGKGLLMQLRFYNGVSIRCVMEKYFIVVTIAMLD
jgi:hypothetical protein